MDWTQVRGGAALLAAVLGLFWLVAVGPHILRLAFVGDDYIFLDKTRGAAFGQLWSPENSLYLGWCPRPVSKLPQGVRPRTRADLRTALSLVLVCTSTVRSPFSQELHDDVLGHPDTD